MPITAPKNECRKGENQKYEADMSDGQRENERDNAESH